MSARVTVAGVPIIIGGNEAVITGTDADEWIIGTDGDDVINGVGGNNFIDGGDGNNVLTGGVGDDAIIGGDGDDRISGGGGNDVLSGGGGSDTFIIATSVDEAGDDTIVDFGVDDILAVNAAGIVGENPDIDLTNGFGAALDDSGQFTVAVANDVDDNGDDDDNDNGNGEPPLQGPVDLVITTPAGTTTLVGVDLEELGLDPQNLTMEALENAGFLTVESLIAGSGAIAGTDQDDVIIGSDGDDTITGGSGDDIMTGGDGSDRFVFDPSNPDEGADVITDFELPTTQLGQTTPGDYIALTSEQILAASPDLASADGDGSSLTWADFDAADDWSIGESEGSFVLINHPGGSIELQGVQGADLTFADLSPIVLVDGAAFPDDGVPVDDNGDDGDNGDGDNGDGDGDNGDGDGDNGDGDNGDGDVDNGDDDNGDGDNGDVDNGDDDQPGLGDEVQNDLGLEVA